jgi:hypothetical protein
MAGHHFRLSADLPAMMDGRHLTCNIVRFVFMWKAKNEVVMCV